MIFHKNNKNYVFVIIIVCYLYVSHGDVDIVCMRMDRLSALPGEVIAVPFKENLIAVRKINCLSVDDRQ